MAPEEPDETTVDEEAWLAGPLDTSTEELVVVPEEATCWLVAPDVAAPSEELCVSTLEAPDHPDDVVSESDDPLWSSLELLTTTSPELLEEDSPVVPLEDPPPVQGGAQEKAPKRSPPTTRDVPKARRVRM